MILMRLFVRFSAAALALAAVLPLAGCGTGPRHPDALVRYQDDVITADEIERTTAENVLVLVSSRRPNWLRGRGGTSFLAEGELIAYLDGTRLGGAQELRQVTTDGIALVRYFDAASATIRFGSGHQHGVIQVISLVGGATP
jgi:hypothetical protein